MKGVKFEHDCPSCVLQTVTVRINSVATRVQSHTVHLDYFGYQRGLQLLFDCMLLYNRLYIPPIQNRAGTTDYSSTILYILFSRLSRISGMRAARAMQDNQSNLAKVDLCLVWPATWYIGLEPSLT